MVYGPVLDISTLGMAINDFSRFFHDKTGQSRISERKSKTIFIVNTDFVTSSDEIQEE